MKSIPSGGQPSSDSYIKLQGGSEASLRRWLKRMTGIATPDDAFQYSGSRSGAGVKQPVPAPFSTYNIMTNNCNTFTSQGLASYWRKPVELPGFDELEDVVHFVNMENDRYQSAIWEAQVQSAYITRGGG